MEQFYRVLRGYNLREDRATHEVEWTRIYQADTPPRYWTKVGEAVAHLPRQVSVVEIGSGAGDVLALLLHLGFLNVLGLERDVELATIASCKLESLFGRGDAIVAAEYPIRLCRPNVLVQVNCMYTDGIADKATLLDRLRRWHCFNGIPDLYILEVVDASFKEDHAAFPPHIRFEEREIRSTFHGFEIEAYETYSYPRNSCTKRLYAIKPSVGADVPDSAS